jgi:hypothetical protein
LYWAMGFFSWAETPFFETYDALRLTGPVAVCRNGQAHPPEPSSLARVGSAEM